MARVVAPLVFDSWPQDNADRRSWAQAPQRRGWPSSVGAEWSSVWIEMGRAYLFFRRRGDEFRGAPQRDNDAVRASFPQLITNFSGNNILDAQAMRLV